MVMVTGCQVDIDMSVCPSVCPMWTLLSEFPAYSWVLSLWLVVSRVACRVSVACQYVHAINSIRAHELNSFVRSFINSAITAH